MEPNEKIKAFRALNDTVAFAGDAGKEFGKLWEDKDYRFREDEVKTARELCRKTYDELQKVEEAVSKFAKLNKFVV